LKNRGREEVEGALENRDDAAECAWGTFWVFLFSIPILIPFSILLAGGGLITQLGTHCTPASGLFSLPPFSLVEKNVGDEIFHAWLANCEDGSSS
jgi:hypothetical protein